MWLILSQIIKRKKKKQQRVNSLKILLGSIYDNLRIESIMNSIRQHTHTHTQCPSPNSKPSTIEPKKKYSSIENLIFHIEQLKLNNSVYVYIYSNKNMTLGKKISELKVIVTKTENNMVMCMGKNMLEVILLQRKN